LNALSTRVLNYFIPEPLYGISNLKQKGNMARQKKNPDKKKMNGTSLGFEATLWAMADKQRGHMDAAEYKHVVLGLIFLKYISDAFEEKHNALVEEKKKGANPEDKDEYLAENIFWVPKEARWSFIQGKAKQPTIGKIIDDAMVAIERDNTSLKGVLPKDFNRPALDKHLLGGLIDLIGTIGLGSKEHRSKDILGRVYEYFLSQFASAEGKKGGQFYAPVRGRCAGRNAGTLQRTCIRSLLRLRRHVRPVREVCRGPRRQGW
jgi:type I restriction enzyme M protein